VFGGFFFLRVANVATVDYGKPNKPTRRGGFEYPYYKGGYINWVHTTKNLKKNFDYNLT